MRFARVLIAVAILAVVGYAIVFTRLHPPCSSPISYRIGTIDPQFGLSPQEVQADLQQAAQIWEQAAGKPLFQYDPDSDLPVNFVYGDIQRTRESNSTLMDALDQNKAEEKSLAEKRDRLLRGYDDEKNALRTESEERDRTVQAYNADVEHWNREGSAPPEVVAALAMQRDRIAAMRSSLVERVDAFNRRVSEINALVEQYNALIAQDKRTAGTFNLGAGERHIAGNYQVQGGAREINVFEVADSADLITLLAHELGHALGLQHNANPQSIMAASGDEPPYGHADRSVRKPSQDDLEALHALCHADAAI